jgi:hypothetical protein
MKEGKGVAFHLAFASWILFMLHSTYVCTYTVWLKCDCADFEAIYCCFLLVTNIKLQLRIYRITSTRNWAVLISFAERK